MLPGHSSFFDHERLERQYPYFLYRTYSFYFFFFFYVTIMMLFISNTQHLLYTLKTPNQTNTILKPARTLYT